MLLKGKKTNLWNKINDVEYIPIPEYQVDKDVKLDDKKVFNDSKYAFDMLMIAGIIVAFSLISWIFSSYEEIKMDPKGYIISWIIAIVLFFIGYHFTNQKKYPILTLTKKGFKYKKDYISWSIVKNMYVKRQNDGDSNNYDLVVENKRNYKEYYSLDHMEENYYTIVKYVSKYYYTWLKELEQK